MFSFQEKNRKTSRRSFASFTFFFDCARHKEKSDKKEMPFSGALPLVPTRFFEKKRGKKLLYGASANLTIKSKTVGTDEVSDGFLPRLNYTSVESESTYSVFIKPFRKFFGSFFQERTEKSFQERTENSRPKPTLQQFLAELFRRFRGEERGWDIENGNRSATSYL